MFALSLTTSYAFKALACLVEGNCPTRQIADIARCTHVPRPYLAKVVVLLVRAGLVATKRGYRGGISLARSANEISLLDVVIAVEGGQWASECLLGLEKCQEAGSCPTSALWTRIRGELQAELDRLTLAEFVLSRSACAGSVSASSATRNSQDSQEVPLDRQTASMKKPMISSIQTRLVATLACGAGILLAPLGIKSGEVMQAAPASDADIILELFQEKGLISAEDVAKARSELARRSPKSPEMPTTDSRFKFADWVKGIDLYGDARLRFEHRGGEDGSAEGDDRLERNRWRYRLRAGARMEFTDQFRAGIQLETGPSGRSSNVTLGDDAGPWGKNSDGIHLGLLYLNWTPTDWFSATAGRQANPFKVTSLVWDGDLAPEGISESFKHKAGKFDLFATFGQYVYDDSNPDNVFGAGPAFSDAFLFVNQVGARFNFNKDVSAQIAPVLNVYSGEGDTYRVPFVGTALTNSVGINDLLVLEIPAEVKFKVGSIPARVFGDFALNLKGEDRARAAGDPDADDEIYAWQAGAELGSARKKGGWSLKAFYQMSDLYALDANMVDSDLFDSRLNMKGFVVQGVYAFTDFLNATLTYANGDRNSKSQPTGAVGDLGGPSGTAFLEDYQLFQADLNLKF